MTGGHQSSLVQFFFQIRNTTWGISDKAKQLFQHDIFKFYVKKVKKFRKETDKRPAPHLNLLLWHFIET